MNNGTIAGEFSHEEFDHSSMLKVAFRNNKEKADNLEKRKAKTPRLYLFSLISMLVLYMVCGFMSPSIFSKFGVELLAVALRHSCLRPWPRHSSSALGISTWE